jgi:hypothetical protein
MIDNILYKDDNGLILTVATQSTGSSSNILYSGVSKSILIISTQSNGPCDKILYPHSIMEDIILLVPERVYIS